MESQERCLGMEEMQLSCWMDDVDICKAALAQGRASEDWRKDVTVPLDKGKGRDSNS